MHSYSVSGRLKGFILFPKTTQELECESSFQAPTTTNDWEFVVPLSQMSGHEALGISYVQILYRLQQSEKRLQHQSDVRKNYADILKEYEEFGHMRLVSVDNVEKARKHCTCPITRYSNTISAQPTQGSL